MYLWVTDGFERWCWVPGRPANLSYTRVRAHAPGLARVDDFIFSIVSPFSCQSYLSLPSSICFWTSSTWLHNCWLGRITSSHSNKQISDILFGQIWRAVENYFLWLSYSIFIERILKGRKQNLSKPFYLSKRCVHTTKIHPSANLHPGCKKCVPPSNSKLLCGVFS